MLASALAGLGLGLSLIVAIGAQNLFVLRQGIRREFPLAVALTCAVSDAILIVVGVSGLGAILQAVPWLIDVVRWAGALFLTGYAILAARRALRPSGETLQAAGGEGAAGAGADRADADAGATDARDARRPGTTATVAASGRAPTETVTATRLAPVLLTCLALTWLNPHVYLDTVFLLGSVAATHGEMRWWFAGGAVLASVVWFFALALGARHLSRFLASPRAWRVLDGVIAVVMLAIAVSLVLPVLTGA